jgi:hypothetical protein
VLAATTLVAGGREAGAKVEPRQDGGHPNRQANTASCAGARPG